ncbi:alpha/beta fold hydrolase [Streptomyces sp. NBC_01465]|uniref:alpha/beta fold hydrolase n=1 Tax=Streptomyces sp. NBC_01465 TaxID=2903878 RepID=UPI002E373256|nr:alpha/beta hydrolase [Streptomyces sp. NBC_01465]
MANDPFLQAYDAVLAQWPEDTAPTTVPTPYGATRVNSCGPRDAPPLLLLPGGGGATSTAWFATAAALGRTHRVHAADLVGEPGRTVPGATPLKTPADLMAWLDALLDGLGLDSVSLCGHSYGGWIALRYALHAPARTDRLVLLDPTQCFTGFRPGYLLRALPMLLRPTSGNTRAFLTWETAGAGLDPAWLRLQALAPDFPSARPVTGPRPTPAELRTLKAPTLLLLAGRSRAHDIRKAEAAAKSLLPHVETAVLADASHHSLPHSAPRELGVRMREFLLAGS